MRCCNPRGCPNNRGGQGSHAPVLKGAPQGGGPVRTCHIVDKNLRSSFHNFQCGGFNTRRAAKFISSFLPNGSKFIFTDDSLMDARNLGRHCVDYLGRYHEFTNRFWETMDICMELRAEEEARTCRKYGIQFPTKSY